MIPIICGACGTGNENGSVYCIECGGTILEGERMEDILKHNTLPSVHKVIERMNPKDSLKYDSVKDYIVHDLRKLVEDMNDTGEPLRLKHKKGREYLRRNDPTKRPLPSSPYNNEYSVDREKIVLKAPRRKTAPLGRKKPFPQAPAELTGGESSDDNKEITVLITVFAVIYGAWMLWVIL